MISRIANLLLGAAMAACLSVPSAHAQEAVSLELLLAIDVSASVDADEFDLQKEGIVEAFQDPGILEAVLGQDGVAVAVMLWAGAASPRPLVVEWSMLVDQGAVDGFLGAVAEIRRPSGFPSSTAIGNAIEDGARYILDNDIEGTRRVVDISADGKMNDGVPAAPARDAAAVRGVTINGLAVLDDEPDLEVYFRDHVVTPDGFVQVAGDYEDFIRAMASKLWQEIAELPAPDAVQVAELPY
ncbi:MAG TPA: DUF1194 domain-containing protein [Alphaproteobacteria bacterium]|nr:DUF1194 domain-containing protein [Alphaproteobacteria bacterium]